MSLDIVFISDGSVEVTVIEYLVFRIFLQGWVSFFFQTIVLVVAFLYHLTCGSKS